MKKFFVLLALISSALFFNLSCERPDPVIDVIPKNHHSENLKTTVTGIVLDETNAPLTGVTVTAYGETTTTSQYGTFVFKNISVNKDRCVLQFSKTGFFKRSHGFIASGNTVNYVRIVLISNAATQNFSSSAGGTVSLPDGSSAQFQPNSFVTTNGSAYTGTVNLAVKHLSPDDANFGFMIPGGDLLGKDAGDNDVSLYTYGMLGVELTGSIGEELQLASGTTASLTFSIAASQTATAPATIPLWYVDETSSLWKEEGTANKVGNNYVGTVKHFSWWNCDYGGPKSYLNIKVIDCNGMPLPNVVVSLNGCADGMIAGITNQNGEYSDWIPSGYSVQVQVLAFNNNGIILESQPENISGLSPNQIFNVPDLIVPCNTRVIGTIKSCSGEATDGFVSISNATGNSYQFTTNGAFNLIAPDNAQVVLYAMNSNYSYSQNITTLVAPNNLNVGSLILCDTINPSENNFILNGDSFSNQLFNILPTTAIAQIETTYTFYVTLAGTALPAYTIQSLTIALDDSLPGTYAWQTYTGVYLYMQDPANSYQITPQIGLGSVTIVQVDNIGGRVKGFYSGQSLMDINNGGQNIPVSISGNFNVLRTQ